MQNSERFQLTQELLTKYLPFISQWDMHAIAGDLIHHPWIEQVQNFNEFQNIDFDANRNPTVLKDQEWLGLTKQIELISQFPIIRHQQTPLRFLGKTKKQHEYRGVFTLMQKDFGKKVIDFGGGLGNLAFFLEQNLQMKSVVLEKDIVLIQTGKKRLEKYQSQVKFHEQNIDHSQPNISALDSTDLAIGLHTCGNFANNMLRTCIKHKARKIINYGCCYSKITDKDYNICSVSNKELIFNQRALSVATLGFSAIPIEQYKYRLKIMSYKYSFYHWLYKNYGLLEFCSMSNARRSLYTQDFNHFMQVNTHKFFPEIILPDAEQLLLFYHSDENIRLNNYFKAYYAIARYLGKLLEIYLLLDRAIYLEENNYSCEIIETFDPIISPRNKALIATLN